MIILGNPEFATGMKLAGIKQSYIIRKKEDALKILKDTDKNEFIIANVSIIRLVPELEEFTNVISLPDNVQDFSTADDLKEIIKSAVGIEINI